VDSKKTINYLINKDMDAQTSNFTKRLAEKKNILLRIQIKAATQIIIK